MSHEDLWHVIYIAPSLHILIQRLTPPLLQTGAASELAPQLALSKSSLNVCWMSGWIDGMDEWMNETHLLVSSSSCPSSLLKLSVPHDSPCLATLRSSPFSTISSLKQFAWFLRPFIIRPHASYLNSIFSSAYIFALYGCGLLSSLLY